MNRKMNPSVIVQDMPPVGGYKPYPFIGRAGQPKGFTTLQIWAGFFAIFLGGTYLVANRNNKENDTLAERTKQLTARSDVLRVLYHAATPKQVIDTRVHLIPTHKQMFDGRQGDFAAAVDNEEKRKTVEKFRKLQGLAQFNGYRLCEQKTDDKCILYTEIDAIKAFFE